MLISSLLLPSVISQTAGGRWRRRGERSAWSRWSDQVRFCPNARTTDPLSNRILMIICYMMWQYFFSILNSKFIRTYKNSTSFNQIFCTEGDILLEAVRQVEPGVAIGKILIQRDESHPEKLPELFYQKLPKDIAERFVILVDPLLATAGESIYRVTSS